MSGEGLTFTAAGFLFHNCSENTVTRNITLPPIKVPPKLAMKSIKLHVRPVSGWVNSSTIASAVPMPATHARVFTGPDNQGRSPTNSNAANKP